MRVRRFLLAGVCVALLGFVLAGSAQACSCAPLSPREALQRADAAIVGELVRVVPRNRFVADYRYRVKGVYRGRGLRPGQTISVRSARQSSACALPRRRERRYGLFLAHDGRRWTAGTCSLIAPRLLRAAAQGSLAVGRRSAGGSNCPS